MCGYFLLQVLSNKGPVLIVIDDPCIDSLHHLQPLLGYHSNANIIILYHSVPDDDIQATINVTLHRGTTARRVEPLSQLQVTQHLVYYMQSSYHLAPGTQEQRNIEYLSSLFHGASCTVSLIWSLVRAWIDKVDDVNDGINSCVEQIEAFTKNNEDTQHSNPENVIPILIACLIDCGVIDTSTRSLLYCLSLFDGAPLPMSIVTAICNELDNTANEHVGFLDCFTVLYNNQIIHRYPNTVISPSPNPDPSTVCAPTAVPYPNIADDDLYYIPQYISNCVVNVMDSVDTLVAIKAVSASLDNATKSVDQHHLAVSCYLPSLVRPLVSSLMAITKSSTDSDSNDCKIDVCELYVYCLCNLKVENQLPEQEPFTSNRKSSATSTSNQPSSYAKVNKSVEIIQEHQSLTTGMHLPFTAHICHKMDYGTTEGMCTKTFNDEGLFSFGAGISCYKQEKYKDALDHFQVSKVRMSRCIKSSVFSSVSLCHLYMGDIETALCHYSVAVDHYHEAVHTHQPVCLVEHCFGLDHVTLSGKLHKLAQSLHSAKRIVESEHCYREAISCASDTSPADQLAAYTDLGNLLHSIGDNERAVEAYSAAVGLAEEIGDHVSLAWVHGNLGKTYLSLGKKERGMHHLEKSLDLTYVHDPSPSSISRALSNIGTGYQAIDRLDKAEEYYDQALCQAIYSNDVMGLSHAYGNLGNLYLLRKDQEKAIPHYTEVVLRLTKHKCAAHNMAYHNRGSAYYELGEKQVESLYITKQRKEFQHIAYGHHTADFESKNQPIALDKNIVASFEKGLDDFEKVIKNVEDSFRHITESTKGLDMFVSLFETNYKTFARAIDCAYYLKDIYKSLCLAEQCRSRTLGELLLKKSHSPRIPLTAPLSLDQIMSIMKHHEPNVPVVVLCYTGTRLLVWVMVYDGVELHTNMFEQQPSITLFENMPFDHYLRYSLSNLLTGNIDMYGEDKEIDAYIHGATLEKNFKRLDMSDRSVVPLAAYGEDSNKIALNKVNHKCKLKQDNANVINETEKDAFISEKDSKFSAYNTGLSPVFTLPQTRDKVHAIALLNKLIASPLHSIIKATLQQGSSKKIVLIPDSNTKLVPFSAIGDQGELLGDRYCIQYAPSLLTLGIMLQVPSTTIVVPRDSGDMCVVGDPITSPFKFKGDTWDLGPLPHAKEEAEWVSQFTRASPLVEYDATKEAVLSRLKRAKLIHLATHGSANHTFIVLAGSRYGSQSDDKKLLLHASEVEALSLAPALVILSSCNSGRGIIKGDDTQNMARAFLIAGAQAVLTSIWKVPDQSARYFVQYFYRYMLDGHSSSEALQKATLSLRCFTLFSQHIHWSGYQITGTIIFA